MIVLELYHANAALYPVLIFKMEVLCPKFPKGLPYPSPQTHIHSLMGAKYGSYQLFAPSVLLGKVTVLLG